MTQPLTKLWQKLQPVRCIKSCGEYVYRHAACLFIGMLLAGLIGGVWRSLGWTLVADTAIFHYIGWRITEGAVPYRDIIDINLPGTYLLHAAAIALMGKSDAALRAFDLGMLFVACAGIAVFCWRISKSYALVGALLFANFHLWMGIVSVGQRDFLMAPFLIWALYCFARFLEDRQYHTLFISGLLLGYVCWIKPTPALLLVAETMILLVVVKSWRARFDAFYWLGLGAVVPGLLMLAWLWGIGGWPDFWQAVTALLPIYETNWIHHFKQPLLLISLVSTLLMLVVLALQVDWRDVKYRAQLAGLAFAFGVLHYYMQRKGLTYHAYPAVFFATLWVGVVYGRLLLPLLAKLACLVMLGWVCWLYNPLSYKQPDLTTQNKEYTQRLKRCVEQADKMIPAEVRATSKPSVHFMDFIYGYWNTAYALEWRPKSRHLHPFAIEDPFRHYKPITLEFYRDMVKYKPWFILLPWHMGPLNKLYFMDSLPAEKPWTHWVDEHYTLLKNGDCYVHVRIK